MKKKHKIKRESVKNDSTLNLGQTSHLNMTTDCFDTWAYNFVCACVIIWAETVQIIKQHIFIGRRNIFQEAQGKAKSY